MLMRFNRAELVSLRAGLDVLCTVLPHEDERRQHAEALLDHIDRAPHQHSIVVRRSADGVEILSDSDDLSDLTIVVQGDATTLHRPVVAHDLASKIVAETLRSRDRKIFSAALLNIRDLLSQVKADDGAECMRRILQQILEIAANATQENERARPGASLAQGAPAEAWEAGAPYLYAEGD